MYHLPSYYDILNTPGTADDITLYERIARRFNVTANNWLEPGCGTGRHLRVLSHRGYSVWGYDSDAEMLAYASRSLKKRGLTARLYRASMDKFIEPIQRVAFDVAINPHSTIRHLDSERSILAHLNQIAACLRPDGLYIVGLSLSRYGRDRKQTDLWYAARGRVHVRQDITYTPPTQRKRVEYVDSRLTITRPSRVEFHKDGYRLRTYDTRQWERTVHRSMLKTVAILDEHGDRSNGKHLPYQLHVLTCK